MARKFCYPCGLPHHGYYRIVKFDGFYSKCTEPSSAGRKAAASRSTWLAGTPA
jgi:hypothetical protein